MRASVNLIIVAALVAMARPLFIFDEFGQHVEQSYQALAHGIVFGLLGAWLATRHGSIWTRDVWDPRRAAGAVWGWTYITAVAMTVVEVVCAAITIILKHDELL